MFVMLMCYPSSSTFLLRKGRARLFLCGGKNVITFVAQYKYQLGRRCENERELKVTCPNYNQTCSNIYHTLFLYYGHKHSTSYVIIAEFGSSKGGGTSATSNWYAQTFVLCVIPWTPSRILMFVVLHVFRVCICISLARTTCLTGGLFIRGGD